MRIRAILFVTCLLLVSGPANAKPTYASAETQRVIEAMVDAHGGLERWRAAPAIRFDDIMHDNYAGKSQFAWWIAKEVIDQKTRQVYQLWPMEGQDMAYDGERVWARNWKRGNIPSFSAYFFYYFVNLPWLTQDDGIHLSDVTRFDWPGMEREFYEVKMTFSGNIPLGKTDKDYFVLYIDPDTYRLAGYQYAIGYRPQMDLMQQPKEREVFGPLWRFITRYQEVEGLLFPTAFHTMPEADERIVGNHVILNIDVTTPWDPELVKMPDDAVIDQPE